MIPAQYTVVVSRYVPVSSRGLSLIGRPRMRRRRERRRPWLLPNLPWDHSFALSPALIMTSSSAVASSSSSSFFNGHHYQKQATPTLNFGGPPPVVEETVRRRLRGTAKAVVLFLCYLALAPVPHSLSGLLCCTALRLSLPSEYK